jgi:RNA-directed DNA polymerase
MCGYGGTPQGGVISPLLMNLFMHYAFDAWMERASPNCPFARYADDAVVHCRSQKQAEYLMRSIASRLADSGLTMHPGKSRVVYCKDSNRTERHPHVSFTFLGFTFRPRKAYSKHDQLFTSFLPGASDEALQRMRQAVRGWRLTRQTHVTLADVARLYNPVIQGWWQYYGVGLEEYRFLEWKAFQVACRNRSRLGPGSGFIQDPQSDRSHARNACTLRRKKAAIARSSRRRF